MSKEKGKQIPHPEDEIEWNFEKNEGNPSLDFVNGVAYVSQFLPTREGKVKCYVISSERNAYVLGEDNPPLPFIASVHPQRIKKRWSGVKNFLERRAPFVSIGDAFKKVRELREFYMDYPVEEYYDLLALWDLATYFHPLFNAFPIIYLNAIKRSGKTKSLDLSSLLAFNSKLVLDPTASTMFRLSNNNRCTILIDEIKRLHQKAEENLKLMIRGKFQKGAIVPRSEEGSRRGKFDVVEYELYSPLAMANIKGIESDIEDRVIRVVLRRTQNKIKANREIDFEDMVWDEVRNKAYLSLMDNYWVVQEYVELFNKVMKGETKDEKLVEVDRGRYFIKKEVADYNNVKHKKSDITEISVYLPLPSTSLMSRDLLVWKPILVMARLVSEELFLKMLKFAESMCSKKEKEDLSEDFDIQVVRALLEITTKPKILEFGGRVEGDRCLFRIKDITKHLKERYYDGEEFAWVNEQAVGNALKRLDIHDDKKKIHGVVNVLINFKKLDDFALSIPLDPEQVREDYVKELGKLIVNEIDVGDSHA